MEFEVYRVGQDADIEVRDYGPFKGIAIIDKKSNVVGMVGIGSRDLVSLLCLLEKIRSVWDSAYAEGE